MATAAVAHLPIKSDDTPDPTAGLLKMSTSALRNKLGEVISRLGTSGESILLVTHSKPKAVLLPYERFVELLQAHKPANASLEFLSSHYDNLVESMGTPASRTATEQAFGADAETLATLPLKG